ncbi:MAG: M20/M25/M40 family metallo-hydrolase [Deltaproteobacteria bacterium]|nr:M20/M25/M40 family metallo-hydrolase [Deltaproteobacteria bacterium]
MHKLICDIIEKFGGRMAGSREEDQAQDYIIERMGAFCDKTLKHRFLSPLTAMHGSLKIFSAVFFACLILCRISLPLAFLLAAANTAFVIRHFLTYRYKLDFLFPKKASSNAIGIIEPSGEHKSTLLFAGHMDSTTEYKWWYRLGFPGMVLTSVSVFMIILLPLFFLADLLFESANPVFSHYWWILVLMSPALVTLVDMRGDYVIDGAQDNLSGVVAAFGAGEALSADRLTHTRIMVVSFGSEEAGLRGSSAFAADFHEEMMRQNAVLVNLDGIMYPDHLKIIRGELNPWVWYSRSLIKKMEKAFLDCGAKPLKGVLPIGATDGAAFAMKGLSAITLIAQNVSHPDPTYHTRLDVADCVDPKALEKARDILVAFARNWDREISGR